jgi:hypothetical protein
MSACAVVLSALLAPLAAGAPPEKPVPFKHKVDVFRHETEDVVVFSLALEQPFFAEEFEQSNYLRLQPMDERAYLIYPKETRFHQKHAAFFGRLRGEGTARLLLEYESVTENLDGSRDVAVRRGEIDVVIPAAPTGSDRVYHEWARHQNDHVLELLRYYPNETFLQYCLLQSAARYGVTAPKLPDEVPTLDELETDLYAAATGALAIQQAMQCQTLTAGVRAEDQTQHVSQLSPPAMKSLPYADLLKRKQETEGVTPRVPGISAIVPEDQYLLQFNSMSSAGELLDLVRDWGGSLLRLIDVRARNNQLQTKFEQQLVVRRDTITRLFADGVIAEVALTGGDLFFVEGTDVTLIFRLKRPEVFKAAASRWLEDARSQAPDLLERAFHYRGHEVAARYTEDRTVSSFVVFHDEYAIYSNSHAAIRKIIDTISGSGPRLSDVADFQYMTTNLPPNDGPQDGYFYASEAFLRRQISPAQKISEKRRVQCFNNLVMLNNASMFYRLDKGVSPTSLIDLATGRFIDPEKLICPHGGAYAFDTRRDAASCSLHNRLKYLTPNAELDVLKISREEQQEYERYKERYRAEWGRAFDPVAVRIHVGPTVRLEVCVLPFANSTLYEDLRAWLAGAPAGLDGPPRAAATVASVGAAIGRARVAESLRGIPGFLDVLAADPTLTDLSWIGDRVTLNVCDGDAILEIDPTRLRPMAFIRSFSVREQAVAAGVIAGANLPSYVAIDVKDRQKAGRFLELLASKIFLKGAPVVGLPARFDAYRLPDYKDHATYVVSWQLYALKVRLHMALIGDRLVAATKADILREVIDASEATPAATASPAHLRVQMRFRTMDRFKDDMRLYWAEKARLACHGNIMSIYNLVKLYDKSAGEVNHLSEAKYGVTYFCPDGGHYEYDASRDLVRCSVHGNRQLSRQDVTLQREGSFARFIESLDELAVHLKFGEECLIASVDIIRPAAVAGSE